MSETITLRGRDVYYIRNALNALDGRPEAVSVKPPGRSESESQVILKPYTFSGRARYQISKWNVEVRRALESLDEARKKLVSQYADPTHLVDGAEQGAPANVVLFDKDWAAVLSEPVQFSLSPIRFDDLRVDENLIPPSVLAVLDPILVW